MFEKSRIDFPRFSILTTISQPFGQSVCFSILVMIEK
jgi:hypothetical protein